MKETTENKEAELMPGVKQKKGCFARVEFIAVFPEIQELLDKGLTLGGIYEALRSAGKITMSFRTFKHHLSIRSCGKTRQPQPLNRPFRPPKQLKQTTAPALPAALGQSASKQGGSDQENPSQLGSEQTAQINPRHATGVEENKFVAVNPDDVAPDIVQDSDNWK